MGLNILRVRFFFLSRNALSSRANLVSEGSEASVVPAQSAGALGYKGL